MQLAMNNPDIDMFDVLDFLNVRNQESVVSNLLFNTVIYLSSISNSYNHNLWQFSAFGLLANTLI